MSWSTIGNRLAPGGYGCAGVLYAGSVPEPG